MTTESKCCKLNLDEARNWKQIAEEDEDHSFKGRKPPLQVHQRWTQEARELIEAAKQTHVEAGNHQQRALQYARQTGEYLLKAKRRVRSHGRKWEEFISKEWPELTKPTRCAYMRVAKYWDDPRIEEARRGKMSPNSISGFLQIIGPPDKLQKKEEEEETTKADDREIELDELRQLLREYFRREVKKMKLGELRIFEQEFDNLWPRMHAILKNTVCVILEDDYYEEGRGRREAEKKELRQRSVRFLNRDRKKYPTRRKWIKHDLKRQERIALMKFAKLCT